MLTSCNALSLLPISCPCNHSLKLEKLLFVFFVNEEIVTIGKLGKILCVDVTLCIECSIHVTFEFCHCLFLALWLYQILVLKIVPSNWRSVVFKIYLNDERVGTGKLGMVFRSLNSVLNAQ